MTTYATMRTRIADELVRSDLTSQINLAIQSAVDMWAGVRFAFNAAHFRINTVASTETYTLPTALKTPADSSIATGEDLLEIDGIVARWSGRGQSLRPVSYDWIAVFNPSLTTGSPAYYARLGAELRLAPVPDAVYNLYITGLKKLATLSADGDTNAWMTDGERLIRNQAKLILARDVLRNPELEQEAQRGVNEAKVLLDRRGAAQNTQRLMTWGY